MIDTIGLGSAAQHTNVVKSPITPSADLMNYLLFSPNGTFISIPFTEPHKLWNNPIFNREVNTTIVVTGWNSNVNLTNGAIDSLHSAYRKQNVNFVVCYSFHC